MRLELGSGVYQKQVEGRATADGPREREGLRTPAFDARLAQNAVRSPQEKLRLLPSPVPVYSPRRGFPASELPSVDSAFGNNRGRLFAVAPQTKRGNLLLTHSAKAFSRPFYLYRIVFKHIRLMFSLDSTSRKQGWERVFF